MSDLSNITLQEIESKLLIILYANENKIFDQYVLWNKLIDKLEINNKYINPTFKNKYLIVLRNLKNRFDDIEIVKENNIYKAYCKKDDIKVEYEDYEKVDECEQNTFDINDLNNYILDNNLYEELDYEDSDGNTIYHDLISGNNYFQVNKLINANKFNYLKVNKNNKTPVDLITNQVITNLIIKDLLKKMNKLENKIFVLENKNIIDKLDEISLSQFIKVKLIKFQEKYKFRIIFFIILIMAMVYYLLL